MTFEQYIDNPMGKSNAVFSQREAAKAMYTEKYDRLILRESGRMYYQLFFDKSNDEYYAYIRVPSETVVGFYYDVVVKFLTSDNGLRTAAALSFYDIQFFSNDPAFVYTYANVFNRLGLFIPELKSKASKTAMKNDPVEKNAYGVPGYVKSIYFAYLFMKTHALFQKNTYRAIGTPYSSSKLKSLVMDTEQKLQERQDVAKDQQLAKKRAKMEQKRAAEVEKEQEKKTPKNITNAKSTKKTAAAKTTKASKSVGSSKKSNKVKYV